MSIPTRSDIDRDYGYMEDTIRDCYAQIRELEEQRDQLMKAACSVAEPCPDCGQRPGMQRIGGAWHVECGDYRCPNITTAVDADPTRAVELWEAMVRNKPKKHAPELPEPEDEYEPPCPTFELSYFTVDKGHSSWTFRGYGDDQQQA